MLNLLRRAWEAAGDTLVAGIQLAGDATITLLAVVGALPIPMAVLALAVGAAAAAALNRTPDQ
jgi:hypothetical protein